ncbi:hypothetical protein TNCV_2094941 [Trichonephila clavipes]|nr:hypothetical protein TNCV_2094941 [Trichonephila clavipes]
MVVENEKWATYYNIVGKRSWSKCGEAAQTVAKPEITVRKVLLCIWWDWKRNHLLGDASAWPNNDGLKKRKTMSEANDVVLDRALYLWFSQRRSKGDPISCPSVVRKRSGI